MKVKSVEMRGLLCPPGRLRETARAGEVRSFRRKGLRFAVRDGLRHAPLRTVPEDDPAFGQVVGRHLHLNFVSGGDPDEVLAHFAADMSQNFVSVLKFHTIHGRGEYLVYGSVYLNKILIFLGWHKFFC